MLKRAWSLLIMFVVAVVVISIVIAAIKPFLALIGIAVTIMILISVGYLIVRKLWRRG
jgi:uncharacterized membrane protein YvlD (DUF360 family)